MLVTTKTLCLCLPQMGHLTLEDYQIWSVKSALANEFLNLLFQVRGHTHTSTFFSEG